jgi:hypothetical protein
LSTPAERIAHNKAAALARLGEARRLASWASHPPCPVQLRQGAASAQHKVLDIYLREEVDDLTPGNKGRQESKPRSTAGPLAGQLSVLLRESEESGATGREGSRCVLPAAGSKLLPDLKRCALSSEAQRAGPSGCPDCWSVNIARNTNRNPDEIRGSMQASVPQPPLQPPSNKPCTHGVGSMNGSCLKREKSAAPGTLERGPLGAPAAQLLNTPAAPSIALPKSFVSPKTPQSLPPKSSLQAPPFAETLGQNMGIAGGDTKVAGISKRDDVQGAARPGVSGAASAALEVFATVGLTARRFGGLCNSAGMSAADRGSVPRGTGGSRESGVKMVERSKGGLKLGELGGPSGGAKLETGTGAGNKGAFLQWPKQVRSLTRWRVLCVDKAGTFGGGIYIVPPQDRGCRPADSILVCRSQGVWRFIPADTTRAQLVLCTDII